MIQDRAIVTMDDQYKVIYGLSNDIIFNGLEQPHPHTSRSGHSLMLSVS